MPNPPASEKERKYWVSKKRWCTSTTVKGHPCGLKAVDVRIRGKRYRLETCIMHSSSRIKKELGIGQGGAKPGAGRKPSTPSAVLRARVEADVDRYLQPLEDALQAMRAVVVGNGASAHIEFTEDLTLRIQAVEKILDRIYGKPKQATEITGHNGAAIEIELPSDQDRVMDVARVLAEVGAVPTPPALVIPKNESANEPTNN